MKLFLKLLFSPFIILYYFMKLFFKFMFLPFTVLYYFTYFLRGCLFGILLFPLAALGIDPFKGD